MTGRRSGGKTRGKQPAEWTPQMQFSKRIARVVMVFWICVVTAAFVMLVIWREVDAMMALIGWTTSVMITMVGAYTGNSMYEKHLDKSTPEGFYSYAAMRKRAEDTDGGDDDDDAVG